MRPKVRIRNSAMVKFSVTDRPHFHTVYMRELWLMVRVVGVEVNAYFHNKSQLRPPLNLKHPII